MGDLGTIFNDVTGNQGSGNSAQKLAANGYKQFQNGQAPNLNMAAYGPTGLTNANAAQINQGQANQFLPGEQNLVSQLQAQAQGSGPSQAQAQLRQGTEQNLATQLAAAAGQRGNQDPGAARSQLAMQAAATNQAAAGQAAQTRGAEQLSAEQGLGQALGAYGGQQIGLAENQAGLNQEAGLQNAAAANQNAQFNTQQAQAGNNAQQQQYQYGNTINETQQNNENAAIAGQQLANQNASNAFSTGVVGGAANAAGGALAHLGGGSSGGGGGGGGGGGSDISTGDSGEYGGGDISGGYAAGGLVTHPEALDVVGEHNRPEVVVPLDHPNPHAFLDEMMHRYQAGEGDSPGQPIDHETMGKVLAEAVKHLGRH